MQVEAIYNQGRIELTQPLKLRHTRVRVIVEVPDEEVIDGPMLANESSSAGILRGAEFEDITENRDDILNEIKVILGPLYRQRTTAIAADDKQALLESLSEKYGS